MNPAQRIVRVSRVERDESCLISVTKNGNQLLDVKLVATEGENAFAGTRKFPFFCYLGHLLCRNQDQALFPFPSTSFNNCILLHKQFSMVKSKVCAQNHIKAPMMNGNPSWPELSFTSQFLLNRHQPLRAWT
jgi:hypothetical protein